MDNLVEFEVGGVSRSGRIRKKSSKLIDLVPDEKPKRNRVYKSGIPRRGMKIIIFLIVALNK